jgi:hypothetical protein
MSPSLRRLDGARPLTGNKLEGRRSHEEFRPEILALVRRLRRRREGRAELTARLSAELARRTSTTAKIISDAVSQWHPAGNHQKPTSTKSERGGSDLRPREVHRRFAVAGEKVEIQRDPTICPRGGGSFSFCKRPQDAPTHFGFSNLVVDVLTHGSNRASPAPYRARRRPVPLTSARRARACLDDGARLRRFARGRMALMRP